MGGGGGGGRKREREREGEREREVVGRTLHVPQWPLRQWTVEVIRFMGVGASCKENT